ncbi:hypothetical protein A203_05470 [Chromobacterium violaceum]|uniref:DUF262 domain-containing protein n=1 Tax=Chromobacterium violaceum TaxID=536 RepID=UPI003CF8731F
MNSQFDAKTFGVGELISQRKLFRVPHHQRSYAWGKDAVDAFLMDIEVALENGASDYFIGLIVIQASQTGEWVLLDGQQRLTTVSLIYGAIRQWFDESGLTADAQQIHHDFLGVRRLGGSLSSRMLLNDENQPVFEIAATQPGSDRYLISETKELAKSNSNKLLINAALVCRKWVNDFSLGPNSTDTSDRASRIYELARFLESKLKVVAVEVSSDIDAYILFESLNDRGVALSALDLLKNHIFSLSPHEIENWNFLMETLGDENPEDFLKVFWTSRYGVIQKSQIFKAVKTKYDNQENVAVLLSEMQCDANILAALYDDDHLIWESYGQEIRDQVYLLRTLESKQSRPLIIAILRDLHDHTLIRDCLHLIGAAIVRFQVIGKGRTGVVEKVFGRLCEITSSGALIDTNTFSHNISELFSQDDVFLESFSLHQDRKYSRIAYLLAAIAAKRLKQGRNPLPSEIRNIYDTCRLAMVFSEEREIEKSQANRIGNYQLVDKDASGEVRYFALVRPQEVADARSEIEKRSRDLGPTAVEIWRSVEI